MQEKGIYKKMNALISIIIPTHNGENWIGTALRSVYEQKDFDSYEVIIVCDACEDNTKEVARMTAEEFGSGSRTKILEVNETNDGATRNAGLEIAIGEWIMFMDDDDKWIHDHVLASVKERLTDKVDLIQFAFWWKGMGYAPPMIGENVWPNVWSKVWRRSFIGDTRFEKVKDISDLVFTKAIFEKRPRLLLWDCLMYEYNYMRPGSMTYNLKKEEENK